MSFPATNRPRRRSLLLVIGSLLLATSPALATMPEGLPPPLAPLAGGDPRVKDFDVHNSARPVCRASWSRADLGRC